MVRECLNGLSLLPPDLTKRKLTQQPGLPSHLPTEWPSSNSDIIKNADLDYLVKNHPGFVALSDEFWNSRQELPPISPVNTPDLTDVADLGQEYSSAVGLLNMGQTAYLGQTAYNPFALLRVGRVAMNACV